MSDTKKVIMLGNEAIARGAYEAGVKVSSAYPVSYTHLAGGIGEGLLIKKGQIIKKLKEDELLPALREELLHWNKD